jgi:hypothetical protein
MSKTATAAAPKSEQSDTNSKGKPTHALFHIAEKREGQDSSFWTEVAAGWEVNGGVNIRTRAGAILLPGETYQLRLRKQDDKQD